MNRSKCRHNKPNLTVKLPNGVKITGDPKTLYQVLAQLDIGELEDGDHYMSHSSKQIIFVEDMQLDHLRNAIVKSYQEWADHLAECVKDTNSFTALLDNVPPALKTLVQEHLDRFNEGAFDKDEEEDDPRDEEEEEEDAPTRCW